MKETNKWKDTPFSWIGRILCNSNIIVDRNIKNKTKICVKPQKT